MYPYAASLLPLKAWPGEHPSRPCLLLLPTARVPVAGLSLNEVRSLVDQGEAVVFRNVDNLSGEDVERVRASVAPAPAALHIKRAGGINPGVPNKDNEGLVFGVQAAKVMGSKEKARVVFDNKLETALLGVGKTAADGNGVTNLRIGVVHPNSDGSYSLHTLLPGSLAHSVTVMNTQVAASGSGQGHGAGQAGEHALPQTEAVDVLDVIGLIPPVGEAWEDEANDDIAEWLMMDDHGPEHAAAFLNAGGNDQGVPQQGAILSAHDELEWAGDLL